MPNLFQKFKNNLYNPNKNANNSNATNNDTKKNDVKISAFKSNTHHEAHNEPSISENKINSKANNEPSISENKIHSKAKNSLKVMSLIIDSSILNENSNQSDSKNDNKASKANDSTFNIFDPDEPPDESHTYNKTIFIDDRTFIMDDDDELDLDKNDREVAQLNNHKYHEFLKENSCYTINEIPETSSNKSNKLGSRASSRSSLGSESIKTNSSDPISSGLGETTNSKYKRSESNKTAFDSYEESEASGSSSSELKNGSKNALLDALMRKFNVNSSELGSDLVDEKNKNQIEEDNSFQTSISKQSTRFAGDDQKRKQSELEKKINKINAEKYNQTNNNSNKISQNSSNIIDASSSFDSDPKSIKIVCNTGTQMSTISSSSSSSYKPNNKNNLRSISIKQLPQNFECKYLGKTKCKGLWGLKNIREPVDRLINMTKRLVSLDDLPNVETLISDKGIYIIQKLPVKSSDKAHKNVKILKSGLLPISNISYAVQDNVYSKVFSCIVVREKENKVISECYSFLCSKNEITRKMALSITLAFKEYAKLLQTKEVKINKTIKLLNSSTNNEPDSFA